MFLRKLAAEADALVASGEFVEPNIPLNEESEEVVGEMTDPDLKALGTLVEKYRAIAKVALRALERALFLIGEARQCGGRADTSNLATLSAEASRTRSEADIVLTHFNYQLTCAFPSLAAGDMITFRARWLVVKLGTHPMGDLFDVLGCGEPIVQTAQMPPMTVPPRAD